MQSKKTILRFLLKAALIYGIFSFPSSRIDKEYGDFYRSVGKYFFTKFARTGFVIFSPTQEPNFTKISVGNRNLIDKNRKTEVVISKFSTRIRGYLPTLLLLSLIIASPVPAKRKLFAVFAGLVFIMIWIIFRQWIHLLEIIAENPKLKLYIFSETLKIFVSFLHNGIVISLSPSFTFAVLVWLLVTFRKEDLLLIQPERKTE